MSTWSCAERPGARTTTASFLRWTPDRVAGSRTVEASAPAPYRRLGVRAAIDRAGGVDRRIRGPLSAVENRPADGVSQPLIVQDEFANRSRELVTLPTAFEPAGARTLAHRGRRTRGLDGIGRSTELVCGDMRHRGCLAGGIGGVPSGSAQLSRRTVGVASCGSGLGHPDFAARPCPKLLDRLAGPRVRGLHRLEEVKDVLCARGRPQRQEAMVGVRERPPTADRDEAGVAVFREDHGCTIASMRPRTV
jgi:hypothetical protein